MREPNSSAGPRQVARLPSLPCEVAVVAPRIVGPELRAALGDITAGRCGLPQEGPTLVTNSTARKRRSTNPRREY